MTSKLIVVFALISFSSFAAVLDLSSETTVKVGILNFDLVFDAKEGKREEIDMRIIPNITMVDHVVQGLGDETCSARFRSDEAKDRLVIQGEKLKIKYLGPEVDWKITDVSAVSSRSFNVKTQYTVQNHRYLIESLNKNEMIPGLGAESILITCPAPKQSGTILIKDVGLYPSLEKDHYWCNEYREKVSAGWVYSQIQTSYKCLHLETVESGVKYDSKLKDLKGPSPKNLKFMDKYID